MIDRDVRVVAVDQGSELGYTLQVAGVAVPTQEQLARPRTTQDHQQGNEAERSKTKVAMTTSAGSGGVANALEDRAGRHIVFAHPKELPACHSSR